MRLFALLAIAGCVANAECILSCSMQVDAGHRVQASSSQHSCCKREPAEQRQRQQLCPDPSPNLIAGVFPVNDLPVLRHIAAMWLDLSAHSIKSASTLHENQVRRDRVDHLPAPLQRRSIRLLRV
jgi:hypothetical protein